MKRFFVYLFMEIILLGLTSYFFATWTTRINTEWIDTTNATIGVISFIFHVINLIMAYMSFSRYTNKYPKNNPAEFTFNPQTSQLGYQESGNYVIELEEIEKGVWVTKDEQEKMRFDMTGYICPKRYICTYFIRNIHYAVINKNKYPIIKLFKSLNLCPYSKYQNVDVCFYYKEKIYKRKIIDNNKSKITWLMRLMIRSRYYIDFMFGLSIGELRENYIKITEDKYRKGEHR